MSTLDSRRRVLIGAGVERVVARQGVTRNLTRMPKFVPQRLELRPETFSVERHDGEEIVASGDWVALVRAPEGLTVIRVVSDTPDGWRAFQGQTAHELDVPGMLLSIVAPLSAADLPVFVASTYDADLVLVPAAHVGKAAELLRDVGHAVST